MTSNIVLSGLTNISGTIRMPRNLTSPDLCSDLMTMEIPKKKLKLLPNEENSFEHSHFITKVDALSDECYECMQCQSKFEMSDQLLQHLDTHDYYFKGANLKSNSDGTTDDDEKYDCAMCSYSLKSIRDTISEEEMAESLKKHIILEHFKANISPSVMEPPIEVPRQEPQLGLNDNDSTLVDSNGSLKCSICFTTFNQVYQRKIHERYFHSESTKSVTELDKLIQCELCKMLCKSESQYKLHKQMYCNVEFECQQCPQKFPKIANLATHMRFKHGAVAGAKKSRDIFIPMIDQNI